MLNYYYYYYVYYNKNIYLQIKLHMWFNVTEKLYKLNARLKRRRHYAN